MLSGMHFFYTLMKKILSLLFVFGLASTSLLAQMPATAEKPCIEIMGTAETEVVPDEIYVSITLQERSESREKLTIAKQEEQLKQSLKELGIDLSLLTLNSADADYRRYKAIKTDVIISKSYVLKLSTAEQLSRVYEKLDKINVLDAYVMRVSHSKIQQFQKETRIKAIKAGKEKVDYLLEAIGQKAGTPIYITEQNANAYQPMYRNLAVQSVQNAQYAVPGTEDEYDISFRKIKVTCTVLLKYEILNK